MSNGYSWEICESGDYECPECFRTREAYVFDGVPQMMDCSCGVPMYCYRVGRVLYRSAELEPVAD